LPPYENYTPVAERLEKWWADHPAGRVWTEIVATDPVLIFRAAVYRDPFEDHPIATGFAHQPFLSEPPAGSSGKPNKFAPEWTSPYEVCETSAIGRALANAGYATKEPRPSREEMQQAHRNAGPAVAPREMFDAFVARVDALDEDTVAAFTAWKQDQSFPWLPGYPVEVLDAMNRKLDEISGSEGSGEHPVPDPGNGETGSTPDASQQSALPVSPLPDADAETQLAATPCVRCHSTRTKRVLDAAGEVRCEDERGCEGRALKMGEAF
jgi:hypothetical protein